MRKLLFLFMMLCCCFEANAGDLDGKYLSQSGELMFIFSGDSLYIDIAQSQRKVSAFKLVKNSENKNTTSFNAYEAYLKDGRETYREVLIIRTICWSTSVRIRTVSITPTKDIILS